MFFSATLYVVSAAIVCSPLGISYTLENVFSAQVIFVEKSSVCFSYSKAAGFEMNLIVPQKAYSLCERSFSVPIYYTKKSLILKQIETFLENQDTDKKIKL